MNNLVAKALDAIDVTYDDLIGIANDTTKECIGDLDEMMELAYRDIELLSNDAIRDLMLRLALRSYSFSEIKEKSQFKAALGETLRKEQYAQNFNKSDGTVAVRENKAIIDTSSEILAEEIYSLVAATFKSKVDETHRVVDVLKTVLMSRLSEAKLSSVDTE